MMLQMRKMQMTKQLLFFFLTRTHFSHTGPQAERAMHILRFSLKSRNRPPCLLTKLNVHASPLIAHSCTASKANENKQYLAITGIFKKPSLS